MDTVEGAFNSFDRSPYEISVLSPWRAAYFAYIFDVLMIFISSFVISTGDVPADFGLDIATPALPSSGSADSEPQASTLDSILSALFTAILDGTICFRQKTLLNSALCALLGTSDHTILARSLKAAKGTRTISKVSHPVKAALVLETAIARCLECLRRMDPELSSFTVPVLISFIVKGMPFSNLCWAFNVDYSLLTCLRS